MVTGLIVTFALFAMLEVSTRQATLISDKVQSNQLGRQTMTKVVDELHSACVAREFAPIQSSSTEDKLVFVNAYSQAANIQSASESPSEGVYKHEIVFKAGAKGTGTLVDNSYPSTSVSEWPNPTFAGKATSTVLGEHLEPAEVTEGAKTIKYVFRYSKYATESDASGAGAASNTLALMPLPSETTELGGADATKTVGVTIGFKQQPTDSTANLHEGSAEQHAGLELKSQVTLAFSSPDAETPIKDEPCS